MDRREEKTMQAIYQAFSTIINTKNYDDITIQDIIETANIGRSTFYSHFKTKDELLLDISDTIFTHVFSHSLQEEASHDFSKDSFFDYRHLITHIFYHIKDEKELISGIMKSNGNDIFLHEFRNHLFSVADSYYNNYPYDKDSDAIPLVLKKALLVEDFIVVLDYWIDEGFKETPEKVSGYFISLIYGKLSS
ncbi:MAG: TetR/AcrR family transcriptional regulator [Bacilli bacterium]